MIGQLGDVVFEKLKEPQKITGIKEWRFAEHPIIWEETKLQYTGHEPREFEIEIRFHASFCNVKEELEKLEKMAYNLDEDGFLKPVPFFIGEDFLGEYVILEIHRSYEKLFPNGEYLEVICTVVLREFL
jgi:phage protein U